MKDERIRALREFLVDARGKVDPDDHGFGRNRRRRTSGLRREEVAELIDISEAWYARFETGRATLSLAAIGRVADVLALNRAERSRLFQLARPELAAASSAALDDALSGLGAFTVGIRAFAARSRTAASAAELGTLATAAVSSLAVNGLAYWQHFDPATGVGVFVSAHGRNADILAGYVQPAGTIDHMLPTLNAGTLVSEENLAASPSLELRGRIDQVDMRAYATSPILSARGYTYGLGLAWPDPHEMSMLERFALESLAAIADVALHGRAMTP